MKALNNMGLSYNVVVEKQEYNKYASTIDKNNLLILPDSYKDDYEVLDSYGRDKSTGSGPARNFAWDHSIDQGYDWHWIMDDNIRTFYRMYKNRTIEVTSPGFFRAMEDFVICYKNVGMAGPKYFAFMVRKDDRPPFIVNSRIYSCNFIRNDIPYRWRGRYNEDTILSIDILKDGWCTISFYAFLQHKMTTQTMKGGNTDTVYKNGTYDKSKMLARIHPDICRVIERYDRVHHYCDYSPFKSNKLKKKDDIKINLNKNYGMKIPDL